MDSSPTRPRRALALLAVLAAVFFSTPARSGDEASFFPIVVQKQAVPATSYLSVPYTAFVGPLNATSALLNTGACWNDNGTILLYLGAPVNLPHGAVVKEVRVDYYQYYAGDEASMVLYRVSNTSQHTAMASLTCGDAGNGHVATTAITAPTVDNASYSYILQGWGFRCDRKQAIRSVRITYEAM
jgi:hypothetical protein